MKLLATKTLTLSCSVATEWNRRLPSLIGYLGQKQAAKLVAALGSALSNQRESQEFQIAIYEFIASALETQVCLTPWLFVLPLLLVTDSNRRSPGWQTCFCLAPSLDTQKGQGPSPRRKSLRAASLPSCKFLTLESSSAPCAPSRRSSNRLCDCLISFGSLPWNTKPCWES